MAERAPRCADCGQPTDPWRRILAMRKGKLVPVHGRDGRDCPQRLAAAHGPYFKFNWDWYGPSR
jgi:hypothetical protein